MSLVSLPYRLFRYLRQHGVRATAHRVRHGIAWRSRRAYWDVSAIGRRARQKAISRRSRQKAPTAGSKPQEARQRPASYSHKVRQHAARAALGHQTLARVEDRLEMLSAQLDDDDRPGPLQESPVERQERDLPIAVVVPAYQAEDFLDACLESVTAQRYHRFVCYVVDDASTDRTSDIAAMWERRDPRFRLIRHGANRGLSAARNTGLREATEPVITFLDADDLLLSRSLDRRAEVLRSAWADDDVAGVWSVTPQVPEETTLAEAEAIDDDRHGNDDVDFVSSSGECPFNAHAPMLRTDLLKDLGGFDETFTRGAEDWDLWQRILRHGYRFVGASGIAGVYRQRTASMVRRDISGHLGAADKLLDQAEAAALVEPSLCADPAAARPMAELVAAARRLERAAIYAGIAVGSSGDLAALDDPAIGAFLRPVTQAQIASPRIAQNARAGLYRGLGLGLAAGNLSEQAARKVTRLGVKISGRLAKIASNDSAPNTSGIDTVDMRHSRAATDDIDVLLIAESSADVGPLLDAYSARASEISICSLDIEILKGNEGATAAFEKRGMQSVPFNHFAFGRVRPREIAVRRPFGPVTAEIITRWRDDVSIVEVSSEGRELLLDCNACSQIDLPATSPASFDENRSVEAITTKSNNGRLLLKEEGVLDPRSISLLDSLHNRHKGETVVIVGNGPSLNDTPIEDLHGVTTIGVNGIFYAADRFPDPISYYVVEDTSVFRENTQAIKDFECGYKLFPTMYLDAFTEAERTDEIGFFRMNSGFYGRETGTVCHPRFSLDPRQRLYCGQSVTIINLQLAYWMGFSRVVLIGMDFNYTIPEDADRKGDLITSNSDDVNHFHPDYFGKGKTWKDPKLDRVLINYRLAGEVFRADGREIVNATVGGQLDVFPRMELREAVGIAVP